MGEVMDHLANLSFGAPAAEREINRGLLEYFVESEAYTRVSSGQRRVIIGNRGSGKSAIFKVLAERHRRLGSLVIELSPEDYSYEMLAKALASERHGSWAKQGAYGASWKYLIYVLAMKGLTERGVKTNTARKISQYLRDKAIMRPGNPIELLVSYMKRIEHLKIGKLEAHLKTRELAGLYQIDEIRELLPGLMQLCQKRKVFVFIDELDRGWDASEDAKAFVAGLFHACVGINERSAGMQVYLSLRQELYDNIPPIYEDAQKYRDIIERITWDEAALLRLVANRIRHTAPALGAFSDEDAWNAVFAETLEYRQSQSFNYMIDRTLYRPREIIQFCADSLEETRRRGTWPVDYSTISTAEVAYSQARARDIAAEYRFQYPGLVSIFEVFRGRTYTFDREELELLCLGISTGEYQTDQEARWVTNQDPEYLIEVLWRIGFLRAQAVGGIKARQRSGSSYLGPHQVEHLNLRNISRFNVHQMFRSHLGMREAKDKRPD